MKDDHWIFRTRFRIPKEKKNRQKNILQNFEGAVQTLNTSTEKTNPGKS